MVESLQPAEGHGPSLTGGVFVGRQRELDRLKVALEEALSGRGRVVMLAGEPGIGKTRTAQELTSYAETLGAQVLWGRCYEEEGAPPYWPFIQPIRSYAQQRDAEQLQSEMGPGAADIAEIVTEVRDKLPHLKPPPALEPEQARFRLFDSPTFLKNAALSQPLVLVLEDLQWAERSSLLLLEFIAREIEEWPVMVIGTYRDVGVSLLHPLSQSLGSLVRDQRFLRVQLEGLTQQEVEQFLDITAGVSPSTRLVEAVYSRTGGNPLFVSEVVWMLQREGLGEVQENITRIPEGVRDAIGRRLSRLSERCNQVLTIASVIGREFDFKLLGTLTGDVHEEHLLMVIEEALEANMIDGLPGGYGALSVQPRAYPGDPSRGVIDRS